MKKKAMKILALDTALNSCSVAVTEGEEIRAHRHEVRARGHAETLLPMVQELMRKAKISFQELDLIAVSVGPGTFTGLRIGLSAARGISLAAGVPCIGVTTLEALAASVPLELAQNRPILATADARRKEIYAQIFLRTGPNNLATPKCEAAAVPIISAREFLPKTPFVILGEGGDLLKSAGQLDGLDCEILNLDPNPDAITIAAIARKREIPKTNTPPPAPVYLRAPDAKLPGGRVPKTGIK